MLRVLFTTLQLSLLFVVVSSTSEYPKSGEGWYPLSSLGISASRGGRDRATTHWESRAHSNLDDDRRRVDDDRDTGHGQISYPLPVEQTSPLGFPATHVEIFGKSCNELDFSDVESIDGDSRSVHKPILLVSIAEIAKKRTGSTTDSRRYGTTRCRRMIHGWRLQEPVYVEEPRWILIDFHRQISPGQSLTVDDPFFVARGKRPSQRSNGDPSKASKVIDGLSGTREKNQPVVSRRKKRDALRDALRSTLIEEQEAKYGLRPGFAADGGKGHAHGYVSPRNKHSEILDILNEPFFISRGKKDSMRVRRFEWYKRYAKKQIVDGNVLPPIGEIGNRDDCSPVSKDCFANALTVASRMNPRSVVNPAQPIFTDTRGVMEQLVRDGDPFYLARGKRSFSSSVRERFNENSVQRLPISRNTGLPNERPTVSTAASQRIYENVAMVH